MSAVDNLTASMANTNLDESKDTAPGANTATGGDKPINASQNEAVLASAAEGRRLYIGNLAYATTEGELTTFFKGYLVESTSIPTNPRTTRPVGYAFVDVSTAAEAERAISELSGKEILERKVSVQLARQPEPAGERGEGGASGGEAGSGGEGRRRGSGRGRGRGRGRGGRSGRGGRTVSILVHESYTQNHANGSKRRGEAGAVEATDGPTNVPGQVMPLTETTNEALSAEPGTEGTITVDPVKDAKPRVPRERKARGPPEDGVASKTKVMVANLPYEMTEDQLKDLFNAYEPTASKIALRPIPRFMVKKLQARNEPRKGRGFGFVTLANEEQQQNAVREMNGKDIEGREIAVKIAIDSPNREDDEANPQGTEGEANKENGVPKTENTAETAAA
ncbi:MAG: hypothetical protein M1836_005742 [Candelina mexicana]|nr:MAG: hypothetical protein M1836_005742 [Candelina mexicana]